MYRNILFQLPKVSGWDILKVEFYGIFLLCKT